MIIERPWQLALYLRIVGALDPRCGEDDGGLVAVWIPVGTGKARILGLGSWFGGDDGAGARSLLAVF